MITKDNKKIYIICITIIILFSVLIYNYLTKINAYAVQNKDDINDVEISNAEDIDLYKIIEENNGKSQEEEIEIKEEILEFMTRYKVNEELPKETIRVIQEGREGIQQISVKKVYAEGKLVDETIIESKVTKASVDKIVEIGGAKYTNNYTVKVGETVYSSADRTAVMLEPNNLSKKITILGKNEELKVLEIIDKWYRIKNSSFDGWVKQENTTYINPNASEGKSGKEKSRLELLKDLNFDMSLNKPSGLSLEQFKKVLSDSKDVNKIFENNAEYFYYIEKQYNINGLFVAAIGIHESAWGTSKLAKEKHNLFGYGAYDSNPYNGAYTFSNYAESIDLLARVLTKYYLNKPGTEIYNSEKAVGNYYYGENISAVNKKYASDKNWAKSVYSHLKYLYEKI